MKLNFCTLFNSSYLSRGIVLYQSLERCALDFHLFVIAFDEECADVLDHFKMERLTVIRLKEFENDQLLLAKKNRTTTEYCWTCSSFSIKFCIEKFNLDNCTYIDADMEFYQDPSTIINRFPSANCIITPHRYSKDYDQSIESGKYCVQFVYFKNNEEGMKLLNWWVNACLEWCYNRVENGKFGDQKYLDDFHERGISVYDADQETDGIAPWNIDRYLVRTDKSQITATTNDIRESIKPVFYHFHGLKIYSDNIVQYTGHLYNLSRETQEFIYKPYISRLMSATSRIHVAFPEMKPNGNLGRAPYGPLGVKTVIRLILNELKNSLKDRRIPRLIRRLKRHYYFYIN